MQRPDPTRDFARQVVQTLCDAGQTALWAGGCVRDLLMGREPQDYDVATDATPERVREVFGDRRTLAVGESFGVIVVKGPRGARPVEVATFRTEGPYRDGRRPESVRFATAEEDAWRRDFTINGMFYDPLAEKVLDFVDGEADVKRGIVRAIGEPHDRMREDKLRMMRAVRFAATLDFELDEPTARAVRELAEEIRVVSAERIAQELRKMLVNRHRRRAVRLMQQVELLGVLLPELAVVACGAGAENSLARRGGQRDADAPGVRVTGDGADLEQWSRTLDVLDQLSEPRFALALAVLLRTVDARDAARGRSRSRSDRATFGSVPAICRRLRLSNEELERTVWIVEHQRALESAPTMKRSQLKRLLAHPWCGDLVALMRAEALATRGDARAVEFVERYLRETPAEEIDPLPLITGDDLIALGLEAGPRFKQVLEDVRDAQLDGEVRTREEALECVREMVK
jgi:poly(A) polymerase